MNNKLIADYEIFSKCLSNWNNSLYISSNRNCIKCPTEMYGSAELNNVHCSNDIVTKCIIIMRCACFSNLTLFWIGYVVILPYIDWLPNRNKWIFVISFHIHMNWRMKNKEWWRVNDEGWWLKLFSGFGNWQTN